MSSVSTDASTVVASRSVRKVYRPFPRWLAALIRSPVRHKVVALDRIDLTLEAGEVCAVVGPNGAGKTTFFRILAGLTTPDEGNVRVAGLDPVTEGRTVRSRIGWMPSDTRTLFGRQTCVENLWFHGRLQAMGRQELTREIPRILEEVGLGRWKDDIVFSLSSGMQQRLLLARALLHRPRLLLLDEPTGSIDPIAAYSLLERVREIVDEHDLAALISSHRLEEIEALGSRVVLLDRGHLRFDGSLDALHAMLGGTDLRLTFADAGQARTAAARLARHDPSVDGRDVRVVVGDEPVGAVLADLGQQVDRVRSVSVEQVPLRTLLSRVFEETQ